MLITPQGKDKRHAREMEEKRRSFYETLAEEEKEIRDLEEQIQHLQLDM